MTLPARLAGVVEEFATLAPKDRLELLLEFADELPDLPERYREHPERLERVPECQTPLFLVVETGPPPGEHVHLFFSAPRQAPTTRSFAGILHAGLDGEEAAAVLRVPPTFLERLGLDAVVSPLRMRGMNAMLHRVQSRVRTARAAAPGSAGG